MGRVAAAVVTIVIWAGSTAAALAAEATRVLALESDEPDGATTFKDTSGRLHRLERLGDTHHSSKQKKFGRSSIYFDGDGDYLSTEDSPDFAFGTDDFAVEFWFRPEGAGRRFICGQAPADGGNEGCSVVIAIERDGQLRALVRGTWKTYLLYARRETYLDGDWHHVGLRREGDELHLLVDDKVQARQTIGAEPLSDSTEPFSIGRAGRFHDDPYRGYLDRFVVSRRARRVTQF